MILLKVDHLTLRTGVDIPFPQGGITIHQPTIKELGYIGEEAFHLGSNFLNFKKSNLNLGELDLSKYTDFQIFMSVMSSTQTTKHKKAGYQLLSLMFPNYKIGFTKRGFLLKGEDSDGIIADENFSDFRDVIVQMYCLEEKDNSSQYNPKGSMAQNIVEKLKKRHEKLAIARGTSGEDKEIDILNRYTGILSVGLHLSIDTVTNYTVWQLRTEAKRFLLKERSDLIMKAQFAGAKVEEKVKDWMIPIHSV